MTQETSKLRVLIVEDEALVATSLRILLEVEGRFDVVGIADDLPSAVELARDRLPDVALVDIQLARGSSGLVVAASLQELGIACLFMTGNPPAKPRPDLTLGVLCKPFADDALFRSLEIAEGIVRGNRSRPSKLPPELYLYW